MKDYFIQMNNLILGCANSLQAHQVYADFLEDSGNDTRFFRIFLQMRRNGYFSDEENPNEENSAEEYMEEYYWYGFGNCGNILGSGWGDGEIYGDSKGGGFCYE